MIHTKFDILKRNHRKNHENDQRYHFLDHFQLKQTERTAIPLKTNSVCGNLEHVLK